MNQLHRISKLYAKHSAFAALILALGCGLVRAKSACAQTNQAFKSLYIGGSLTKVNPVAHSEAHLQYGQVSSIVNYRHAMEDRWLIGISSGFKSFMKLNDSELSYFSVAQDAIKLYRLQHPLWIGYGFKSMYLAPVERASIPYVKDNDQTLEIGFGLVTGVYYLWGQNSLLHAEVSRWRGTVQNKLHVAEVCFGISFGFDLDSP